MNTQNIEIFMPTVSISLHFYDRRVASIQMCTLYASSNLLFYQLYLGWKRDLKKGWLLMLQSCSLENSRNVQFSESKISIFCNWHLESTQSSLSIQTLLINTFLMLISGVIATLVLAMGLVWCGVLSAVCLFFVPLFFLLAQRAILSSH